MIWQKNMQSVASFIKEEIFARHGVPRKIVTDQGTEFINREVNLLFALLGVKHIVTTAYHAQANGIIERGHQAFTKAVAILVAETGRTWDKHFYNILWADRVTVRRTVGF